MHQCNTYYTILRVLLCIKVGGICVQSFPYNLLNPDFITHIIYVLRHVHIKERLLISYPSHTHTLAVKPLHLYSAAVSFPGSLDLQGHSLTACGPNDFWKCRCCIKDPGTEDVAHCIPDTMANPCFFFHFFTTFRWLKGRVRKSEL